MVLYSFYIKEICVRSPEKLGGISCHVKWCTRIMPEPWIVPPLAEENVHRIILVFKEMKANQKSK